MAVKQRRAREREARRSAILDAGERVLEEVGYRSLRMEQVADEAELSKGTLYLYFDGKDALCAGVAERAMQRIHPRVRAVAEGAPNGLVAIGRMSRAFLGGVLEQPHLIRVALDWFQTPHLDDASEDFKRYRRRVNALLELMVATIVRGQEDGSIRRELDPFHKALHSWSSSLGVHLFLLNARSMEQRMGRPFDPDGLTEQHLDALMRSLASSPEVAVAALGALEKPAEPPLSKAAGDAR